MLEHFTSTSSLCHIIRHLSNIYRIVKYELKQGEGETPAVLLHFCLWCINISQLFDKLNSKSTVFALIRNLFATLPIPIL